MTRPRQPGAACAAILAGALACAAAPATAQPGVGPQPLPLPPPIPQPRDIAFDGVIGLSVNAGDLDHRIVTVHETVPLQGPGPITLLYPRWETGSHAPTGAVASLAGLTVRAGNARLEWRRDPMDPFAFHVDPPAGVGRLDLDFQYLSPNTARAGPLSMTRDMLTLVWSKLLLYPAGWFARDIPVQADLTLPRGFTGAASLSIVPSRDGRVEYSPVSLETLTDSPVYAGRHAAHFDLAAPGDLPVRLDLFADAPADLAISAAQLGRLRAMVAQTTALFGARHYVATISWSRSATGCPAMGGWSTCSPPR